MCQVTVQWSCDYHVILPDAQESPGMLSLSLHLGQPHAEEISVKSKIIMFSKCLIFLFVFQLLVILFSD